MIVTLWEGKSINNVKAVNIIFDSHANVYYAAIYFVGKSTARLVDLDNIHSIDEFKETKDETNS